jgi:hypothetical protein
MFLLYILKCQKLKRAMQITNLHMKKKNGKDKGKRKYISYHKDDNDLYWFNLRHTYIFYVIPGAVLFDKKYLHSNKLENDINKYLYINPDKDDWYSQYKFNYKDTDTDKLLKLFI